MYNRGQAGATTGNNSPAPICAHAHTPARELTHPRCSYPSAARQDRMQDPHLARNQENNAKGQRADREGVKKLETITDLFFTFNC